MREGGSSHAKRNLIIILLSVVLLAGAFFCVYNFTDYLDGFIPKYYSITFEVDGDPHIQRVKKNEMPIYNGTEDGIPLKQTETLNYPFIRWEPEIEKATKNAKYVAVFSSEAEDRHYSVLAHSDYESGYSISGAGSDFQFEDSATLSITINPGFTFNGWYLNGELYSTEQTITISQITSSLNFEVAVKPISFSITYLGLKSWANNPNESTYTILDGELALQNATASGFDFVSWKDENNHSISSIDASELRNRTLTANWQIKTYSISIDYDGGTGSNASTYNVESANITLNEPTKEGFTFTGFKAQLAINNIDSTKGYAKNSIVSIIYSGTYGNISLKAQWEVRQYSISFEENGGSAVSDIQGTYNSSINLPTPSRVGYNFAGWFEDNGTFNNQFTETQIPARDVTLYAKWQPISYSISYELNGGVVVGINPTSYTIESANITLVNPTKLSFNFLGWTESGSTELHSTMVIPTGSYGNKSFIAHYDDEQEITLVVEGRTLSEKATAVYGGAAAFPDINSGAYGMQGYSVLTWFTDSACQNEFNPSTPIFTDTTLYGKWTYLLNNGFIPYLSKFNNALSTKTLNISSRDELIRFIEFVQFYEVDSSEAPTLSFYASNSMNYVPDALDESNFPYTGKMSYSYVENEVKKIYVTQKIRSIECSKTLSDSASHTYTQQDYAYKLNLNQTRSNSFNNFNINNVSTTIQVETSNQLIYALECGLRPVCVSGSKAESVMQKAKQVLIEIIDDSMTDLEKVTAIYEWLIMNVQYDNWAYEIEVLNPAFSWNEYKSWYAEGVFDEGISVCDGISKAFVILAKLENIPIVRVVGNHHAWNKVWLNGDWYGIDATQGNILLNGSYEFLSYSNFLFTDSYKTSCGYTATNRAEVSATKVFDHYSTFKINLIYDLYVNSSSELTAILNQKRTYSSTIGSEKFTVEFALDSSIGVDLNNDSAVMNFFSSCLSSAGISGSYSIVGLLGSNGQGAVYSTSGYRVFSLLLQSN